MASPAEHYREAEKWIADALNGITDFSPGARHEFWVENVAMAQVHATLATATTAAYLPVPRSITDDEDKA